MSTPKQKLYDEMVKLGIELDGIDEYKLTDLKNIMGQFNKKLSSDDMSKLEGASNTGSDDDKDENNEFEHDIDTLGSGANGDNGENENSLGAESPEVRVTIDSSTEDVLNWDKNKVVLRFVDTDPERFKYLDEDDVRKLSYKNMQRYIVAKAFVENKLATGSDYHKDLMFREGKPGSAAHVLNNSKWKDRKDMHRYPARPEEVNERLNMGYAKGDVLVKDKLGNPELIDMAIPEERYQEHIHKVARDSHARIRRSVKRTAEAGKAFSERRGKKNPVRDESTFRD